MSNTITSLNQQPDRFQFVFFAETPPFLSHIHTSKNLLSTLFDVSTNTGEVHYKNGVVLDDDLRVFAKTKDKQGYYPQSEVYYSDNIRLPSKMIESVPIFNFPKRQGAQQVSKFFRVKNLNDISVDVISYEIDIELTDEFEKEVAIKKPYILAYRLENIQKEKDREAKALSGLKISLCKSVKYKCRDKEHYLEDNDYVEYDDRFLIKVSESEDIKSIIMDSKFGDTFSEIVSSVFKVNEHKDAIRNVLRNNNDDTEHSIRKELGSEILGESRELLGISGHFVSFWNAVSRALSIDFQCEITKKNIPVIADKLGIGHEDISTLEYSDIETGVEPFVEIFKKLNVNVHDFNKYASYKIS